MQQTSSQYRQKNHGKGSSDGIGATLKRLADQIVAHGTNIPHAETLFDALQSKNLKVKLFFVPEEKIVDYLQQISSTLRFVSYTHPIHQIITVKHEEVFYRNFSYFCEENKWAEGKFCKCFETVRKVSLIKEV